jgi:hypothetical protein
MRVNPLKFSWVLLLLLAIGSASRASSQSLESQPAGTSLAPTVSTKVIPNASQKPLSDIANYVVVSRSSYQRLLDSVSPSVLAEVTDKAQTLQEVLDLYQLQSTWQVAQNDDLTKRLALSEQTSGEYEKQAKWLPPTLGALAVSLLMNLGQLFLH